MGVAFSYSSQLTHPRHLIQAVNELLLIIFDLEPKESAQTFLMIGYKVLYTGALGYKTGSCQQPHSDVWRSRSARRLS